MDAASPHPARQLALLATVVAGLVVAAALYAAMWTPGSLGLATTRQSNGHSVVRWIAPNGPAWNVDIVPGDAVMGLDAQGATVVQTGHGRVVLGPHTPRPTLPDLLTAGLGLCLLALGATVLVKGQDRTAGAAFWRMSLLAGLALGLAPAGVHGVSWAIVLEFIALRLFGPALLELALAFPISRMPARYRPLLWAPPLALLLCYPLCWWRPIPLFMLMQIADGIVLVAYILGTCAHIARVLRRPRSARQRAQMRALALGLVCGLIPFTVLTLLPSTFFGHSVVPPEISILALVLLPVSVALAIVRFEFLGVTSLVRRRTLRVLLGLCVLAGIAAMAGLAVTVGSRRWGWPVPLVAAGVGALAALAFAPLYRVLARRAERIFLRDTYDTAGTLLELSVDLSGVPPHELGALIVTRLSAVLDLSFALLVTDQGQDYHAHPRSAVPETVRAAAVERAHVLRGAPPDGGAFVERVRRLPVLFLPVAEERDAVAMLCLGPKRGGDRYTAQDRVLLGALGRHLAVVMHRERLRAQVDRQMARLREVAEERGVLVERVLRAAEEERQRLAGVLHDEAIQVGGEVVRQIDGLLALPHLPLDIHMELAATAGLSADLVARLRDAAAELYPLPLQTAGLSPALQTLLRDVERRHRRACVLSVDPALTSARLSARHELTLYHIAREAVSNAVRHAHAATIHVTLCREDGCLRLSVRDDGDGFTAQPIGNLLADGHLGLALLDQRARDLNGTLTITTAPGAGTSIAVRMPLPAPMHHHAEAPS